ncbi:hypothetical protein MMC10_000317 [Thelotrema lepadinum]|nr:hypothetical protein [Thelotrema lepadinum]
MPNKAIYLTLGPTWHQNPTWKTLKPHLDGKVDIYRADKKRMFRALRLPDVVLIMIFDTQILQKQHQDLCKAIAQWTKEGGRVVLGACCRSLPRSERLDCIFWDMESRTAARNVLPARAAKTRHMSSASEKGQKGARNVRLMEAVKEGKEYISAKCLRVKSVPFLLRRKKPPVDHFVSAQYFEGTVCWLGNVSTRNTEMMPVVQKLLGLENYLPGYNGEDVNEHTLFRWAVGLV